MHEVGERRSFEGMVYDGEAMLLKEKGLSGLVKLEKLLLDVRDVEEGTLSVGGLGGMNWFLIGEDLIIADVGT